MNRIYLLTGATGLLGSNISRKLIERGETVRALVLKDDPAVKYVPSGTQIVMGDVLDIPSLEEFFNVPDELDIIVIHSASIVTLDPNPNKKVWAVNVRGTQNIIDMCLKYRVKKLVYISSTGAIPELPGNQLIREVDHFTTEGLVGYYSVTKAEASKLVLDAVKKYPQLDASIVHPSGICGPNDYAFGPVSSVIIQYAKGELTAAIEGYFNSVDVRDLADGVIACCDKGRRGECYIMANCLVSMKEMFEILNRALGINRKITILSVPVARLIAKIMVIGSKITGKPPKLTDFAIYNLTRNNNFDYSKAEKELGYKCRPFEDTIFDEVRWLKEEGKI